jgi:hypothetical protein
MASRKYLGAFPFSIFSVATSLMEGMTAVLLKGDCSPVFHIDDMKSRVPIAPMLRRTSLEPTMPELSMTSVEYTTP